VCSLLEADPQLIHSHNKQGQTAMHIACSNGDETLVKLLLENSPDLNAQDNQKATPLHALVQSAPDDCDVLLPLLVARGADVNIPDRSGYTPLLYSCQVGDKDVVELLLRHKAKPTIHPESGSTCIHYAVAAGADDIVAYLLAHDATKGALNAIDATGRTPLDYAGKFPEVAALLKAQGAESKKPVNTAPLADDEEGVEDVPEDEDDDDEDDDGDADEETPFFPKDIHEWLQHHSLNKCVVPFKRNKIELHSLATMTNKDIGKLGLDPESRGKLVRALETVHPDDFPAPTNMRRMFLTIGVLLLVVLPLIASMFIEQ